MKKMMTGGSGLSRKLLTVMLLSVSAISWATDNSVYIDQAGDNSTVTMTQDGAGNRIKGILTNGTAGANTDPAKLVGNNQTISTTQAVLTGSFTGSFVGDGSGLTGVSSSFPSTEAVSLMPTNRIFVGTGSNNNTPSYITYTNFLTDYTDLTSI